jgi:hypothetical protein
MVFARVSIDDLYSVHYFTDIKVIKLYHEHIQAHSNVLLSPCILLMISTVHYCHVTCPILIYLFGPRLPV